MRTNVSMQVNRRSKLVVAAMAAALSTACEKPVAVAPQPPEVYVAPVVQRDVPVYLDLVGQTQGFQDVDIRARVEGFLDTVNFREGSFVRKGDLLYQIDPKPLQATLAQANAELATARARLAKTDNDVARYTPLVAKQAVSQRELDDARAAQDAMRAQVEASKAAVEKATLDLGYVRIMSPINGLAGTTQVKPGSLVGRGESTLLTTVSVIDPIIFRVALTEADYLRIIKRDPTRAGQEGKVSGIQLTLADGTTHPHTGTIGPVERAVNATTGTLGVQLYFPNPDNVLRPGQYGRARVLLDTKAGALLVPQRAVQELQNLYSVAIVASDGKVTFRNVKVGPRVDTLWVIEEGLKPGEQVVAEGLQSLRDGMTVRTKPMPAPGCRGQDRTSRRGEVDHGPILRQPADRRDRAVDHHRAARRRRHAGPADRAVSRDRPADGPGDHDVHRRERHRRRSLRRHAARTEDQRRRKRHLHEVDQRQRRHVDAEGLLRGRVEPGHGQRVHAEPCVRGHAADAAVGQELRRDGEKGAAVSAPGHLGEVAERQLRQQLPVELHHDQHQRHDCAHSGRRADQPVRWQRLRDADLAASGSHRAPRHHHSRHRQCDQLAEPADTGRPDRRSAGRDRHRVHVHGQDAGAAARRSGVRQHHPPHQPGRLGSPHQGRRPHRARDDALQRGRPPRRQARRRHRGVPDSDSGYQRSPGRQQHQGDHGRSEEALPARHGLPDLARHDVAGHRRESTRSSTRSSKRSRSSSSSCSSSCRTGARRSSR